MALIGMFRESKSFPCTLTSLVFSTLVLNSEYDENLLIPLVKEARFNPPFLELLRIDVFTANFLDQLLTDDESGEMVINKDKIARSGLVCSIFSSLVKITEVDYVSVILKHFLV